MVHQGEKRYADFMALKLRPSFLDRLISLILLPGDGLCRLFKVQKTEHLFFLRLYLNLFIYTKIAVVTAIFLAMNDL